MNLEIDGETIQRLLKALDWHEWDTQYLQFALCGSYEMIPVEGTISIVSWPSGQEVASCNRTNNLFESISALAPDIYCVQMKRKKVVIYVPADKKWRLFVNHLQHDDAADRRVDDPSHDRPT